MKRKLDKQLCAKYPKLFRDRNAPINETCMYWGGFECGDGWYNIINQLCGNIQNHIDWKHIPQVVVTQVKEKFGTLRFYYSSGDDVIDGMVRMAEAMSAVTCEECGSPGEQRSDGWVRTLCNTHAKSS